MIELLNWDVIEPNTERGVVQALKDVEATVLGQVVVHIAEGNVVFTAIDLAGDTLFFGKLEKSGGETLYEVPAVTGNYERAAAKWNQRNDQKFPPLKDVLFDNWEDMIRQIAP